MGDQHPLGLVERVRADFGLSKRECEQDAELRQMLRLGERFARDPRRFVARLSEDAVSHIRSPQARESARQVLAQLSERAPSEPADIVAEALRVASSDLRLAREMASYAPDWVIERVVHELSEEALAVARRLVRNAGRRLLAAKRPPPAEDDPEVRPLAEVLAPPEATLAGPLESRSPLLVVATAGRGTRLRTTIPKALLPLAGRPMISRILDAASEAGIPQALLVLRFRAGLHRFLLGPGVEALVQPESLGTAHTVAFALRQLGERESPVVVSYSDTPFLKPASFRSLLEAVEHGPEMSLLTIPATEQPEFGRLVRADDGRVRAIAQPRFGEVGTMEADAGLYALRMTRVLPALLSVSNRNHRYEYSFTAVVDRLWSDGAEVATVAASGPAEVLGVNRPEQLEIARRLASGKAWAAAVGEG